MPFKLLKRAALAVPIAVTLAAPVRAEPALNGEELRALKIIGSVAAHARSCGNREAEAAFDWIFAPYPPYTQRKEAAYRSLDGRDSDRETCARIGKLLPDVLLWGRGWRAYRTGLGDPALQP